MTDNCLPGLGLYSLLLLQACEAWKKEAEDSTRRAKLAEEERMQAIKQRDEALSQLSKLRSDSDVQRSILRSLPRMKELELLPLPQLQQFQQQLRGDLETLDKVRSLKCQ